MSTPSIPDPTVDDEIRGILGALADRASTPETLTEATEYVIRNNVRGSRPTGHPFVRLLLAELDRLRSQRDAALALADDLAKHTDSAGYGSAPSPTDYDGIAERAYESGVVDAYKITADRLRRALTEETDQ